MECERWDFPCGSDRKEATCNVGDLGSVPGLGRSPGEGNGYPLQYSGLENSMDYIVHRVKAGHNRVTFTFYPILPHPFPFKCVKFYYDLEVFLRFLLP